MITKVEQEKAVPVIPADGFVDDIMDIATEHIRTVERIVDARGRMTPDGGRSYDVSGRELATHEVEMELKIPQWGNINPDGVHARITNVRIRIEGGEVMGDGWVIGGKPRLLYDVVYRD